jgi:hypothetical protein
MNNMNMKINITVMNFNAWQKVSAVFPYDHVVVGYRTPGLEYPSIEFSPWCKGHLEIHVHDTMPHSAWPEAVLFNEEHAKQILALVEKERENIHYAILQCDAGISRSSATAAALSKIIYGTDEWVFNSPFYVPNTFIYKTILNVYHEEKK